MTSNLTIALDVLSGEFERRMVALDRPIAGTASETMDDVAGIVKTDGRADIARAGFNRGWQNALRVDRYPKAPRTSIDASVYVYHRIPYAGVFEDGATITGSPLLWVPLDSAPKKISGRKATPALFQEKIGPLVSLTSRNGNPILAATAGVSRSQAASDRPKVTLASLRRGADNPTGVLRTIPMFVGIRQATVGKQLSIREICERARNRIPSLYAQNFNEDNG